MATGVKGKTKAAKRKAPPAPDDQVLYLYGISRAPKGAVPAIPAEGIDGLATVEAIACEGHLCWVSQVERQEFADNIASRMEDLEWLASSSLRHQQAVVAIAEKLPVLPARFATVFVSRDSMARHVKERKRSLSAAFERVKSADEWGVKVFAEKKQKSSVADAAVSGADYLKRKAEGLRPIRRGPDMEVRQFAEAVAKLAVAACPGGKASAGQPGLLWHGSFLVRRVDHKKLERLLKRYAKLWQNQRRIEWSGPWPPYSFVGDYAG